MCQISKGARKKTQSGFRIWTKEANAEPVAELLFSRLLLFFSLCSRAGIYGCSVAEPHKAIITSLWWLSLRSLTSPVTTAVSQTKHLKLL